MIDASVEREEAEAEEEGGGVPSSWFSPLYLFGRVLSYVKCVCVCVFLMICSV